MLADKLRNMNESDPQFIAIYQKQSSTYVTPQTESSASGTANSLPPTATYPFWSNSPKHTPMPSGYTRSLIIWMSICILN